MSVEQTLNRLTLVNRDSYIQNQIAQANARYILLNTGENRENFPRYNIQDNNLNLIAFYYLNNGCYLAENQNFDLAIEPMERGASILEYVHGAEANRADTSTYYGLIAALGYYVCFQYSKSFILIGKISGTTIIAQLVSLFLKRDFAGLINEINELVIDDTFTDNYLANIDDEIDAEQKIYEINIAWAINGFVKYLQTGDLEILTNAKSRLNTLKEIAELNQEPGVWWVIRLLLLIANGFDNSSLWNALSPYFDLNNDEANSYIKSLIYQYPRGIYELFITQRKSLAKVLDTDNPGCVVSIPTSSGKTRIAEIAILKAIHDAPLSKALYIAPFRSLAFEIENTLEKTIGNANITISHLYGGSLYSRLDEKIIEDSNVIIATPEKAKAILRGSDEIIETIKLVIIDEGHLLGPNKRLIVNEIFYEELRHLIEKNGGQFLVLSAVLPNSEELAQWLTSSASTVVKDTWRPSDERIGILEWNGTSVNLNWESTDEERASYNNRFIVKEQLPLQPRERTPKFFPADKNDAIATTAYRLRTFGPVLIFVGIKGSVSVMAKSYLKNLGNTPADHTWQNQFEWKAFELACIETYGEDNEWLTYARKGIICHNADLHADVRLPLERLMRNDKPLVIIATSTLAQGVNLGVSSVIFSTLYQAGTLITARDFWNIAGRAGRAFVDHEGKILVALDTTNNFTRGSRDFRDKNLKISRQRKQTREYFNKQKIDLAHSGILSLIKIIKDISVEQDVSFDHLMQLITENKIVDLGEKAQEIDDTLDWIDDTLLSLHYIHNVDKTKIDYGWIEDFFKKSLAYIQSPREEGITGDEVVKFMKSRIIGISKKVGSDKNKWKSHIKSGIPLNSDLLIEGNLQKIIKNIKGYNLTNQSIDNKILLLKNIEAIIVDLPVLTDMGAEIKSNDIDFIRSKWIKGVNLSEIFVYQNGASVITKLFTYTLPWILNGIAKKIRNLDQEEDALVIEELSLLVETGLPDLNCVKIYQAGIRSRTAAIEISKYYQNDLWTYTSKDYKTDILNNSAAIKKTVSKNCCDWIDLLLNANRKKIHQINVIPDFEFSIASTITTLVAKKIKGDQYLLATDLSFYQKVEGSDVDFSKVTDIPGIFFILNPFTERWEMKVENPYVQIIS